MPSDAWRAEADRRIDLHRRADFRVRLLDPSGAPVAGRRVTLELARHEFSFGVAVDPAWLDGDTDDHHRYRGFVLEHFDTLVAENCMKWYDVEPERGQRSWAAADRLRAFADEHALRIRGHCLFWSKTHWVQPWARNLPKAELRRAVRAHLEDAVSRFRGRLTAWDINNEMIDGSFFRDRLGPDIRPWMFRRAAELDPAATTFLNEYTILQNDRRLEAYLALVREIEEGGATVGGIGIQEHDAQNVLLPDARAGRDFGVLGRDDGMLLVPEEVWARLDRLAKLRKPIHLTEITSWSGDDERRAEALRDFYRMGFAHPGVEAILLWGFWEKRHFRGRQACLFDAAWKKLPAARLLGDLLRKEWTTRVVATTDAAGEVTFRGFRGTYDLRVGRESVPLELGGRTRAATVVL